MPHGHGGAGENPEEIHAFADTFLMDGKPLAKITGQGQDDKKAWATCSSQTKITKAEFNFTKDSGKWQERKWETLPAELSEDHLKCSLVIPDGISVYYFNVIDERGLYVSSEHVVVGK